MNHSPQPERIRKMFSEIASSYDRTNTILSVGIHHLWRRQIVAWSGLKTGAAVLDCATGTGDLAIVFKKAVGPSGKVIGTDFCAEMMQTAPDKALAAGLQIEFQQADVTALPFATASFDGASISFGIRNVGDPVQGLRELGRVVKPGGVVMVLEFGQPKWPVVAGAYRFYSNKVLPQLGGWITGRPQAYDYLQTSAAHFPCGDEFLKLATQADRFARLESRALSFGVVYMYKLTVR